MARIIGFAALLASLPGGAWAQDVTLDLSTTSLDIPFTSRLMSLVGLLALMLIAWGMSTNRRLIPWRIIGWGVGLQLTLGVLVLRTGPGRDLFAWLKVAIDRLIGFYEQGANLIFGGIQTNRPVFVLSVLPTIIFFSSLMAVLYHLRVMQFLVGGVAFLMRKTLRTSGAETLSAASNIFVGQTEAPLLIKPFLDKMTLSELNSVMTGGFATVAGGIMAAYILIFGDTFPGMAGHLITASVLSAPAALLISKLMLPEEEIPATAEGSTGLAKSEYANVIDAATTGAADGLKLALNVAAMLLAFVALVALMNFLLGTVAGWVGYPELTMQSILGWVLSPLAWLMGVPWDDAQSVGQLLGTKTILNEWMAYDEMAKMIAAGTIQHPRSVIIATYALCGFANFGSIAIQVGGISAIAPKRRKDLAKLGMRAMIGGTLAAFMTATVAGMLL